MPSTSRRCQRLTVNSINPVDYIDAAQVAGIAMMVLGAGLLIFIVGLTLKKKKPECDCDDNRTT